MNLNEHQQLHEFFSYYVYYRGVRATGSGYANLEEFLVFLFSSL